MAITFYATTNNEPVTLEWFQLEEGTTATEYTPYVADVSGSTLSVYGKNLCDYTQFKPYGSGTITQVESGFTYTGTYYCSLDGSFLPIGQYYCMSWKNENADGLTPVWRVQYKDNTYSSTVQNGAGLQISKPIKLVLLYPSMSSTTYTTTITDIQLEIGSTKTAYQPYQCTNYIVGEQNGVTGVKSVYPVTMLVMGDGVVTITAEYYLDAKRKINDIEQAIVTIGDDF